MFIYIDTLGNKVTIYFEAQENNPDDVLIIPKTKDGWLFTEHKIRGLEFPGKRRTRRNKFRRSETRAHGRDGAISAELHFVADYLVESEERTFTKRVYAAHVISIESLDDYLETKGPVIIQGS